MKSNFLYTIISLLVLGIFMSACQQDPNHPGTEFAPQMYVSKPYEPYTQVEKNSINPKGLNVRHPAKGTIARRRFATEFEDANGNKYIDVMAYDNIAPEDYETAAAVLKNPYSGNEEILSEGKVLYERVCYPCHGAEGDGKGPVAEQYKGVANLKGSAYTNKAAGHIFHVITHGKGRMWPHGSQLNPSERWKVVSYVFKLQGRDAVATPAEAPVEGEEATPADSTATTTVEEVAVNETN